MVRIPVTLADFESGRVKSSVSKLAKHHPNQPVKPKRSLVQQIFAQILGYGGYEELRSQAKQNGAVYSGQPLAIDQHIAPISLRISRYWGLSARKAEYVATALGLIHLDAFRPTARHVQSLPLREVRVSPSSSWPNHGVSARPIFEAMLQAKIKPLADIAASLEALKPMAQLAASLEALKPMAQLAASLEALKPTAQLAASLEALKPTAQLAASLESLKPTAQMAAMLDAMKPTAQMVAMQDAMKPTAQMVAMLDAMKPTAQMVAMLDAMKPTAQMVAMLDAMKPTAQMVAMLDAMKPT
ncbi:hypothetical protein OP492_03690, partial [Pseudomonas mosselii]|nr:hypothetical protein [Pseudomonas mosselii]